VRSGGPAGSGRGDARGRQGRARDPSAKDRGPLGWTGGVRVGGGPVLVSRPDPVPRRLGRGPGGGGGARAPGLRGAACGAEHSSGGVRAAGRLRGAISASFAELAARPTTVGRAASGRRCSGSRAGLKTRDSVVAGSESDRRAGQEAAGPAGRAKGAGCPGGRRALPLGPRSGQPAQHGPRPTSRPCRPRRPRRGARSHTDAHDPSLKDRGA
jgi:hypothetical protein